MLLRKPKNLSCLGGSGSLAVELLDYTPCTGDKFHIALGKLTLTVKYIVFHAHADVSTHGYCGKHDFHGALAHAESRPGAAGATSSIMSFMKTRLWWWRRYRRRRPCRTGSGREFQYALLNIVPALYIMPGSKTSISGLTPTSCIMNPSFSRNLGWLSNMALCCQFMVPQS